MKLGGSSKMNRTSWKLFAILVIAAVFGVACGSSSTAAKKTGIGDILYNNDAYQTAQQKQMQAYADSLGIQIVFENQLGVGTNAPNLMDDLLSKGVNGIIFQPAHGAGSVAEDALQRDKGFNIATGCNSDMAFGALQAFKAAGLGGATNKKPDHTYFYSINGTDEELKALVDPSSPLMEVLGLTPKEISQTLIDTVLKMIKGTIDPYGNYVANVPDKPIPADCAAANTFNQL